MANIDDAFTVDTLSLDDNVLITSGTIDPTIGGYEAPVGSLFLKTDGKIYQKHNTADVDWEQLSIGLQNILENTFEPTGITNRVDSTVGFVEGTRTYTIQPVGSDFTYFIKGTEYTVNVPKSIVIPDVSGTVYIYLDDSLNINTTALFTYDLMSIYAYAGAIYWNALTQEAVYVADERHGITMDGITHIHLHTSFGTQYITGLGFSNMIVDGNGSSDSHTQFDVANGIIRDEDLQHNITDNTPQQLTGIAQIPVLYKFGTSDIWHVKDADDFPFIQDGTAGFSGSGLPAFNELVGNDWQLNEVSNNNFFFMHYLATNDIYNPIVGVLGIQEYQNKPQGKDAASEEFNSLTGLPFQEYTPLATVIYKVKSSYSNSVGAIIVSTDNGYDFIDWKTAVDTFNLGGGSTSGADELVKISANDLVGGTLNGKLVNGGSLTFVENNDGGNETLTVDTSIPLADIQTEIDNIEAATGGLLDTNGVFDSVIVDTALQSVVTPTSLLDALTQMDTAIFGSVPISDLATVVVARSASIPVALTYTDLSWDLTNVENIPSIIEHDTVNTDNIIVKETGLYLIAFSLSIDANATEAIYDIRIRINDTIVMPGSIRQISEDDEINDVSNCITVELTANDFLTLQTKSDGTGDVLGATSNMMVTRLKGVKGDKGDIGTTGSGTNIVIEDDDVAVLNTPHSTINFIGATVTDAGAGQVDVDFSSTSDLGSVVLGILVDAAIPTSLTDVPWDIEHLENDVSVIEHSPTNPERVVVKETGLYFINYSLSFDADAGEETITAQVLINGTTVVPGSLRVASEDDEINDLSNAITATLNAGDYVTVQQMASGAGNLLHNSSNFSVTRARGAKGEKGTDGLTGSGSNVNVLDAGVAVPNTPHANLNFRNNFTLTDNAGTVDIDVDYPVFGTEYFRAESLGLTTSTSTTFLNKNSLTVNNLVGGTYRIGVSYGWNHNNASNDFESRIQENSVDIVEIHKQEPKDPAGNFGNSGTSQRHYVNRTIHRTLLPATSYTYDLDFRTDANGTASGIWEATIEFWRVE